MIGCKCKSPDRCGQPRYKSGYCAYCWRHCPGAKRERKKILTIKEVQWRHRLDKRIKRLKALLVKGIPEIIVIEECALVVRAALEIDFGKMHRGPCIEELKKFIRTST